MQDDRQEDASAAATDAKAQAAAERARKYQERFRRTQAIAAQAARSRAAGGRPSEEEAARLVAEFHARGGQITICPPAEEPPPDHPGTQRGRR